MCHLSISISVFGMIIKIASFMFCSSLYYFVFLKNFAILMIFNVLGDRRSRENIKCITYSQELNIFITVTLHGIACQWSSKVFCHSLVFVQLECFTNYLFIDTAICTAFLPVLCKQSENALLCHLDHLKSLSKSIF